MPFCSAQYLVHRHPQCRALAATHNLSTNIHADFNQYLGILRMGVTCLSLPEERVRADAAVWQRRAHALADALASIGWLVPIPTAGVVQLPLLACMRGMLQR